MRGLFEIQIRWRLDRKNVIPSKPTSPARSCTVAPGSATLIARAEATVPVRREAVDSWTMVGVTVLFAGTAIRGVGAGTSCGPGSIQEVGGAQGRPFAPASGDQVPCMAGARGA